MYDTEAVKDHIYYRDVQERNRAKARIETYFYELLFQDGMLKHFDKPAYTTWADLIKAFAVKLDDPTGNGPLFQTVIECEKELIQSGYLKLA